MKNLPKTLKDLIIKYFGYFYFVLFLILIPCLTFGFVVYLIAHSKNISTSKAETKKEVVASTNISPVSKESKLNLFLSKSDFANGSSLASLQMAFKYFEVTKTQADLAKDLPYTQNPKPIVKNSKIFWDNPADGFVGKIDGKLVFASNTYLDIEKTNSLGISAQALLSLAIKYRPNSKLYTNQKIEDLMEIVAKKQVPLLWLSDDENWENKSYYQTQNGEILPIFRFKTVVLTSYRTNTDNSRIFTILDPENGIVELKEETLYRLWQKTDFQTLVIN